MRGREEPFYPKRRIEDPDDVLDIPSDVMTLQLRK